MLNSINKSFLFLGITSFVLLIGAFVKIDKYEANSLLHFNDSYSKLILRPDSFKKVDLRVGSWFNYYSNGEEFFRKVVSIQENSDSFEIIFLDKVSEAPVKMINYKIGKTSMFSEIFN